MAVEPSAIPVLWQFCDLDNLEERTLQENKNLADRKNKIHSSTLAILVCFTTLLLPLEILKCK